MTIKNLDDFVCSRQFMSVEKASKESPFLEVLGEYTHVYIYADYGAHIYSNKNGTKFLLDLMNNSHESMSLWQLEQILWDWYKYENCPKLTRLDAEEDLHERSREWLNEHHITCSLDEVETDWILSLEQESQNQYNYLTEQWKDVLKHSDCFKNPSHVLRLCWKDKQDNICSYPIDQYEIGYYSFNRDFDFISVYENHDGIQESVLDIEGEELRKLRAIIKR